MIEPSSSSNKRAPSNFSNTQIVEGSLLKVRFFPLHVVYNHVFFSFLISFFNVFFNVGVWTLCTTWDKPL